MIKVLDQKQFLALLTSARANLENNKAKVNDLNVFPVPDGDTGTNMALTIQYALKECENAKAAGLSEAVSAAANGALMGARGNSGVILSQLFRGFSKQLKGKAAACAADLAQAMAAAAEMAYKAVMKPTEGTILTVARIMSEYAQANAANFDDIESLLEASIKVGYEALENTPNLLPVLKEAGVVDAGGQGLLYILQGALASLQGKDIASEKANVSSGYPAEIIPDIKINIEYAYCTEFLITVKDGAKCEKFLIDHLVKLGDSLFVAQDNAVIKVHMHTNEPWAAMKIAAGCGELTKIKVDNLREQHGELFEEGMYACKEKTRANPAPKAASLRFESESLPMRIAFSEKPAEYAVVAVSSGDGLDTILKDLGVNYIISGGQTMNPSTQDFIDVIANTNACHYILFPNNKNITLAARQAAELSEKDVYVIPTTTIPESITAMMEFDAARAPQENIEIMTNVIKNVKTAQITFAVRDSSLGDLAIQKGDIIGVLSGDISVCEKDVTNAVIKSAEAMVSEESELITLYYGSEVNEEDAALICGLLEEAFPDKDVQVFSGGQPLYYFIMSVE